MPEGEPPKQPVKRVKNLPDNKQCLRFPGFECNCAMTDLERRRQELRKVRQKEGGYSLLNLFDPGLTERYEKERKNLCEGTPPKLIDRIKKSFRIRIVG